MERIVRKPFQGIRNVIWFNWHTYMISVLLLFGLTTGFSLIGEASTGDVCALFILICTLFSLGVSYYVYDCSDLYTLDWLVLNTGRAKQMINIQAGFDETSALLALRYSGLDLLVFDFYDEKKHTEVSIKRARRAYPEYPGTQKMQTGKFPVAAGTADFIFAFMSLHEIRDPEERLILFKSLEQSLTINGEIIVVEHLRDVANFIAYNFGFMHFYSRNTWKKTFKLAGLQIHREIKITPFISAFILQKDGNTP